MAAVIVTTTRVPTAQCCVSHGSVGAVTLLASYARRLFAALCCPGRSCAPLCFYSLRPFRCHGGRRGSCVLCGGDAHRTWPPVPKFPQALDDAVSTSPVYSSPPSHRTCASFSLYCGQRAYQGLGALQHGGSSFAQWLRLFLLPLSSHLRSPSPPQLTLLQYTWLQGHESSTSCSAGRGRVARSE